MIVTSRLFAFPAKAAYAFTWKMNEADNGQSLSQRGNYTGSKIAPKRKAQIIALLGAGETVTEIARRTRACRNVIIAIRNANYNEIQHRKELLALKFERIALAATDQLQDSLDGEKPLSPQQLVPIAGVAVDKALALRGDPQLRIAFDQPHHHIHAHINPTTWAEILANAPRANHPQPITPTPPQLPQQGIHAPEETHANDSTGA
jgi:hypothetical protein